MSPDRPLAIRRTRRAEIDLTEIWLYIAEGNEAAAFWTKSSVYVA